MCETGSGYPFLVARYILPWVAGYFAAKEKLVPKCKLMQHTTEAVKTGFQLLNIYRTTRTPEILKRSTILTISFFTRFHGNNCLL